MSTLKLAVLRQVAYAHSIRKFIRAILEKLIPGKWINRVFAAADAEFDAKLDAAFAAMDVATATKDDYRKFVVEVLCGEPRRGMAQREHEDNLRGGVQILPHAA